MADLRAQFASIEAEVRAALDEVLASQQFVLGPQLAAFEREMAQYCGLRDGRRRGLRHGRPDAGPACLRRQAGR